MNERLTIYFRMPSAVPASALTLASRGLRKRRPMMTNLALLPATCSCNILRRAGKLCGVLAFGAKVGTTSPRSVERA